MEVFLQQFQDLKIQMEEIKSATNNFDDETNRIGVGGFGKVYKGEVSHSKGRSMTAIKRLDRRHGQGIREFLKEITTLSRFNHENLISLLGFCYEGDEMILVYEHASHGSLDRHLNSPHLTWSQRLKICLDAAKGLSYLHDPRETHQRLIHCDVKSANILLDDHWNAKVSDFGLAIMGPANELDSIIITLAAGTRGYCDPQYAMTNTLTKESDVYSFGVVLVEVLCGRLCFTYSNGRIQQVLVPTWIESYKQKRLNDHMFRHPTIQPLDQSALEAFSDIAYRCLKESREDRPKMTEVVTELETTLELLELVESQEFIAWKTQTNYYEELAKIAEPPLSYGSEVELWKLLSKGIFLNGGKTLFSLSKKGEHCETVAITKYLDSDTYKSESDGNSRSGESSTYVSENEILKAHVKAQFLTPGITYTVNFVFQPITVVNWKCHPVSLKYKLQGETETSNPYLAYLREDGWYLAELYQFNCDHRVVDLEILFYITDEIFIYGIEFRPFEKLVEHKDENQTISVLDADWEENLPTDFEDIMKWSTDNMQWTTKKEAYSIIRKGFLIDDGRKWFSLDKNGKKCYMISVADIWGAYDGKLHLPESRFGEALRSDHWWCFIIKSKIQFHLVSCDTTYASYLVYKLPKDLSRFKAPFLVEDRGLDSNSYIYLVSPQTPVIRPKADQNTHNPLNKPRLKGFPRQRHDGWMEVQIWEFQTVTTTDMHLALKTLDEKYYKGLIIQGVEFRPV